MDYIFIIALFFLNFSLNFFMDTNLNIFKAVTNLDPGTTFVDKWMSLLDESSQKEASRVLKGFKNPNSLLISQIRNTIFACHLARRWNLPYTEALKIVESGVKNQPYALERLIETLDTLQEKGFDKATVSIFFPMNFQLIRKKLYRFVLI